MADFKTNVPLWGNKGTKPSDGLLKGGYAPNDRPSAQNTNFMYNAFSNAIKEVQDNVPLEANILNKTGDVIEGTILSAPKQLKYSINKGKAKVQGNVNHFSDVSGNSKITITIPKDVVIPGRQTLVFSFLHSFKGEVISLDFSSTYVSDFATTNTDNIKNDEYRKVRLSFTLGENAHNADIVIVMSARERNLFSCTIAEDFVTSGLIGVPYSLKADSLIALDEGAMLPKETLPKLDCNVIRTPYIGYTTNAVNAPQGEKLGTLMVFVTAETSKLTQVFTGNTSGKVYYRMMNIANTFSSWAEVLTGSALADALTNYTTKEDLKKATAGMLTEESATNWQKFKVTQDNGSRVRLTEGTDLLTLATGYYEVAQCKNSPLPETEASWKNVDVVEGISGRKMLRLTVSGGGATFYKTLHTNGNGGRDWWQVADAGVTQNNRVTEDNGRFYYNLTDNKSDILASVASESGFKTGYAHLTVLNGLGNNRSFRFTSYYYPTNGYIHAVDTAGQSHIRVCNGGVWGDWKSIADTSVTQNFKITNDDGSAITVKNYDLLNTTDASNFDGYSNTAINMPAGVHKSGYIKRKIREGFIEVTYSPYNRNTVYRNSYNPETKVWAGWEKLATASEVSDITPVLLWEGSANGAGTKTYPLKQDVMKFSKIKITHYSAVFKNAVSEYAVPAKIGDFWNCILSPNTNLTDARGDHPTIYEVAIRFNNTSFMIERDSMYEFATSKPTLNANQAYITKIEGVRK
ncbi:minor tail protein [Brochothrix phage A9]|uniref:Gp49 n=1 Tax=Brochothrix phage A9 TaxID=857312 RepID=D9J0J6_9CAUD|nr:minor tail protein [Brochothrix phage A9]ADJ53238.1 gp49 [Brochothrix phage A9]